eukprot:scaffold143227_cov23-Prasinocladus_malaysianus.AAC.1
MAKTYGCRCLGVLNSATNVMCIMKYAGHDLTSTKGLATASSTSATDVPSALMRTAVPLWRDKSLPATGRGGCDPQRPFFQDIMQSQRSSPIFGLFLGYLP